MRPNTWLHAPQSSNRQITLATERSSTHDGLRSRTNQGRATEVKIAIKALNRMLKLGRPDYVCTRDSKANRPDRNCRLTRATKSLVALRGTAV